MRGRAILFLALLIGAGTGAFIEAHWAVVGHLLPGSPASSGAPSFPPELPGSRTGRETQAATTASAPLQRVLAEPTEFSKFAALYRTAAAADAEEIHSLILAANGIDAPWDRRTVLSVLYRRYAELDPEGAVALVLATPYQEPGIYLSAIFTAWSRTDLDAAVDQARALPLWLREQAALGLFASETVWRSGNRREIARSLGLEKLLNDLETRWALERSPDSDPATAWSRLATSGAGVADMMRYRGVALQWVQSDPYVAMQAVLALQNYQVRSFVLDHALKAWSQSDGEAAFEWAFSQSPGRVRSQALLSVLEGYADTDALQALALAQRLDLRDRSMATERIVLRWTETDPAAVARWIAGRPEGEASVTLTQNVAYRFAELDADEAMRWADGLRPEAARIAVAAVLLSMATTDPERVALLVDRIEDPEQRVRTSVEVARAWAGSDPQAALAWLETSVDADARQQGQSEILSSWVQSDPEGALAALDNLSDAAARDVVALRLLQSLSFYDAETAAVETLYGRIVDPNVKQRAAASLYSQWAESQPELAEKYRREAERLAADQPNRNPS